MNIDIISLLIGIILISLIWLILFFILRKKPIHKEIGNARKSLREIYKRYGEELFNIADKIDKHFETLEKA